MRRPSRIASIRLKDPPERAWLQLQRPSEGRPLVAGLAIAGLIVSIPHLVAAGAGPRSGQLDAAILVARGLRRWARTADESYFGFLWLAFVAYLALLATAASLPARLLWGLIAGVAVTFTLALTAFQLVNRVPV